MKLLVFLAGKSTAGKTTAGVEVGKKYNSYIIHTDSFYTLPANSDSLIGEEDSRKSAFIDSHKELLTDITIIEGSHIGNKAEANIYMREFKPEKSVTITLESSEFKDRFKKKYNCEEGGYVVWYDSFYNTEEESLTAQTVEEIFNIIQKAMEENIYVYQDQIKVEEKLKNLNYNWTGKSVFEIGCNVGRLGDYLRDKLTSYVGIDVKEDMIELGKERYGLDLRAGDVMQFMDIEKDILVSLAVYHHICDEKVVEIFQKCKCKEMIFEVPVGDTPDYKKYHLRSKEWYEKVVKENYGEVVEIVDSGARNDPVNKRIIFICKKYEPTEQENRYGVWQG